MDMLTIIFSRMQFAFTAGYHFFFVPITLGLSLIVAIMETAYVKTNNVIYKDMVKFWGALLGLQVGMGVATGVPMEFQFGTNWAYYSHYVGDMFGVPLAIEGLMAFFLEATFLGVFFFGWEKLTKVQHCVCTWLVFVGANLSGLWILVANGWMQHPAGASFNPDNMRMELTSFTDLVLNPLVQNRFMHTLSAGYISGAIIVLAVSSIYLLMRKNKDFAIKSIKVASVVGVISVVALAVAGDNQGVAMTKYQPAKLAAVEALWETEPAPASFNVIAMPSAKEQRNLFTVKIPALLGIIDTHSLHTTIIGANDIIKQNEGRIRSGIIAYKALMAYHANKSDTKDLDIVKSRSNDLGYGLLLKRFRPDIENSTEAQIAAAAKSTVPSMLPLFIAFRLMVGIGILLIVYFLILAFKVYKGRYEQKWFLWVSILMLPLPWLAIYAGWFVTEYGRQPWVIQDILPTFLAVSNLPSASVIASFIFFVLIYVMLTIINIILTVKYIKKGPSFTAFAPEKY